MLVCKGEWASKQKRRRRKGRGGDQRKSGCIRISPSPPSPPLPFPYLALDRLPVRGDTTSPMHTLPRHILIELMKVFAIALTGLTAIFMVGGVVREAMDHGLPLTQVGRLIPYVALDMMRYTLPATLLLANTTVFARMAGANEIVAIKALGISPMTIITPALVMAFLVSLVNVWLNDVAVSVRPYRIQRMLSRRSKRSSTTCSAPSVPTVRGFFDQRQTRRGAAIAAGQRDSSGLHRQFGADADHRRGGLTALRPGRKRAQHFAPQFHGGNAGPGDFPESRRGRNPLSDRRCRQARRRRVDAFLAAAVQDSRRGDESSSEKSRPSTRKSWPRPDSRCSPGITPTCSATTSGAVGTTR